MDIDEDENSTQRPKAAADFGIQVDFSSIDDEDPEDPAAALARLDKEINDKTAEIERMAPNMKAMERYVPFLSLSHDVIEGCLNLDWMTLRLNLLILSEKPNRHERSQSAQKTISTM